MTSQKESLRQLSVYFKSLSSYNRIYTFLELHTGTEPKHIAHELDVTRNALQHYIQDWKNLGLIHSEGNEYLFTDEGQDLIQLIKSETSPQTPLTTIEEDPEIAAEGGFRLSDTEDTQSYWPEQLADGMNTLANYESMESKAEQFDVEIPEIRDALQLLQNSYEEIGAEEVDENLQDTENFWDRDLAAAIYLISQDSNDPLELSEVAARAPVTLPEIQKRVEELEETDSKL